MPAKGRGDSPPSTTETIAKKAAAKKTTPLRNPHGDESDEAPDLGED